MPSPLARARRAAWGAHSPRRTIRKPVVRSENGGVVCAQHPAAAEAGARVLAAGGNAVDAAIAAGLCVGVVEPWMSGPGGGGLMLAHIAAEDRTVVIDGGMVAPTALDPSAYPVVPGPADRDLFGWPPVEDARNVLGGAAVAVPGLIDLYRVALETLGTRPWADLVAPAVDQADAGLRIDAHAALLIGANASELGRFAGSVDAFLPGGAPFMDTRADHRLSQAPLAATLRTLAQDGPRALYEGAPAETIVRAARATGGTLSMADMAGYRARILTPATADYRGTTVAVAPDLNGGPSILVALEALAAMTCGGSRPPGPDAYVAYAHALRHAFIDRLARMGDTDGHRGRPSDTGPSPAEESCTSHISVADRDGNLVALTQTLLSMFGARVVAPDSGLLLNNGVYWFDPRPGRPNSIGPGKRPLCNYAPTLVLTHGGGLALGAAGGRRIIGAVTQLIAFLIDHGLDLEGAIHQPRLDVSGLDTVTADARLCVETLDALAAAGFAVDIRPPVPYPAWFGTVGVAQRRPGLALGGADPAHPWADVCASTDATPRVS
ncbi:gamma-glutamyltransferase [Roseospira marina]|uniref:Gamma-glutamyltransferase n=1 Tax=Roseospira marina TaxID=140057 RepID=A0A5M6IGH6_9PROT|nr:gamma-glutamyltransferase [Roseospira marina]KAA5607411.1 gamma-glutamyltransferase [Roseospira marina]MBB4312416.1 gamma-glutamyltranspeptidase/glutathione hydrolase [Roseospira marina]MBB5085568.1 gamma-glutamyltranspeptidase/glutathione hydrolase [Roseospira marina]